MTLEAPSGGRKAAGTLLTSWLVRSLAEIDGFSISRLCTIIAILSVMDGTSVGASPLGSMAVWPSTVAFTTAAVAGTGAGLELLTENACAVHNRQSPANRIAADPGELPPPITEETSNVSVSHSGPLFAGNSPGKFNGPRLPVKEVGVNRLNCVACPSPTMNVVLAETGAVAVNPLNVA